MTWSDYVKVKKIGEGAFGSAWLVKNKKDNKDYVVKKINVAKMPTKEREEAKKEVSVLAQMNHPNIVSYIDSFEEDGNLCIVMDYCDGGDLYTKIQSMRGNPINEDQILDWFVQIALALKHVHDRKILHRDLKSQNIFLTKSGVIKLGDFGVAKVLNNTSEFARTAIGTPYYMSPEICNHMSYNNKSDVWSLGCILFEMTNMKHPFEANNLKMLICKIIRGTYDQVNPRYSYEMRNLVASMLKKNPRERPSVNGILRKPFIMRRCARFLTNEEMQDEFSHTVLHGENFRRKLHVQNNAAAKPSAKPLNVPVVNVLANPHPRPIYDPSKIYGQPLYKRPSSAVQKSQEKKSIDIKRRPPSVERPIIKGSYLEQRQEKKEYDEALLRKKQKELIEKQKVERIKRERELGWQNILPSNDKEQDHNKEKHPFVNYNRGADHYKMYEQQLNEHAKRRQELEEAHDRLADQLKNRVPLVDHKEKIEPKKRANVSKVKKSSEEFKKIKEEYEKNRANGKRIFNNPITPRPQIVKKSNDQQLKEKLDKIRGNKSYLNRKPAVVIKSKQNQIFSNEKPRFGAPLKRPSPLRKGELFKKPSNSILKPTKVYQEKKAIISPKDIKQETEFGITELLDNIGIKGKQISKEEVLKDPNELLFEKPVENRRCWSEKTDLTPLNDFPLIENTVMPSPTIKIVSPRKEWDQPHLSVLNALDQANILTSKTVMFDKTLKEGSNKSSITKGDTYLIGDQVDSKNVKYGPTDSQLINEKPPDFINNLTSNSFKATWEEALSKISPLKSDKLQMTKNMWLEMTLGKFDTKNIQLLRTCSVPDLLSKAINEDSDDDNEVVITKGKIGTLKETAKKAQSLYDLNFENSERSSESDLSEKISYSDSSDLTQVRETMESFLFDSDEENDRKNKNIKPDDKETYDESDDLTEVIQSMQCYLSDEDDLTADKAEKNANDSRKRSDIPLDSLEISKKNLNELNDDNDCEIVSLNGESDGSDTEFEDDKPVFVNCSIEERRAILEKNLGQDELKKNFRCLKALIQEEQSNDLEPNTNRESFKKFVQLFPDKEFFWYYELCFTEAFGLQGQNRVYEVIQNILKYHQNDSKNLNHSPSNIVSSSKVTLTLSDNHLTIVDNAVSSQRKLFKKSLPKAYSINYDKITYVFRLTNRPYSDIVTFITKSLPNESTNKSKLTLFLHAFRCDSDDTAVKLERYLTQFLSVYNKKLEKLQNRAKKNLALDRQGDFFSETGHLHNSNLKNSFLSRQVFNARANTVYDSSSGGGTRSSSSNDLLDTTNELAPNAPHFDSRPTSPLQLDFKNIKKELEYKLKSEEPILYPPKDYDEDDRLRGNLNEIHSRRSQNPSIIGKEAYQKLNASNNSLNDLDEAILTNRSDFTSASFNEQANQVLKMLDDVVNSEIANRPDYDKNIFEFKPPKSDPVQIKKSFRTPGFTNLKYSNMSASMESIYQKNKPSNFRHLAQKSSSIGAGLHDPYLDGNVKTNPLLVIEEEPQISSQFQQSMFKSAIDLTGNSLDQSANSSDVSTKKPYGQRKLSKQSKYSSRKSNQNSESHESDGFRPGVFAKLSSYQPQWLSSSVPNDSFYAKNEKLKQNKNFKLKYSESAKVNRLTEPLQMDFRPALSSKQKFYAKKNLPCVKEDKFEYPENSQFILKPYTNVNERYERDCENKVPKHRIRNNSSYYKSESSLANNNRYVFNDIYY